MDVTVKKLSLMMLQLTAQMTGTAVNEPEILLKASLVAENGVWGATNAIADGSIQMVAGEAMTQ